MLSGRPFEGWWKGEIVIYITNYIDEKCPLFIPSKDEIQVQKHRLLHKKETG